MLQKETPRSSKPLCLIKCASMTLDMLKRKEAMTFAEVADNIVASMGPSAVDGNNERTLRRRVYDVLNVLVAAGFVAKVNKKLMFTKPWKIPESATQFGLKVERKKVALQDKLKIFALWKLLIQRNKEGITKPTATIPIDKTIFVGFRTNDNGDYGRVLDGRQLEIRAESPPLFFSPMDVVQKLGFSLADQKRVLCEIPDLQPMAELLSPDTFKA